MRTNELGQPIGAPVEGWTARPRPPRTVMQGRVCRIEPLDPGRHAADLFAANSADREGRMWTYLAMEPFVDAAAYERWLASVRDSEDPLFHAILDAATGRAGGLAALMRLDPAMGVIEIGHVALSPRLQRTVIATEAIWLFMRRVFDDLGYRRFEWKCDSRNEPSRRAAVRLGFTFEGVFRQAIVYKGRNRDTAWYAIIDRDWPRIDEAFRRWLDPANFDAEGRQRTALSELMPPA